MSIKALGGLQLPNQKEWAAGLGGILAFAIIAGCNHFGYPLGDETDSLLVVVLPALITKLIPPSEQDVLKHVNDAVVAAGVIAGKLTPPEQIVAADPNNTLTLRPAQLVQLGPPPSLIVPEPPAKPSWQDYEPVKTPPQPTRSGIMVDPAVRVQPQIDVDQKPHYIPPAPDAG